jgi:drug/metabolite transporter (DMT)-like permease
LATLIIRLGKDYVVINSAYYVFARFFIGFLVVALVMIVQRQGIKPVRYHYLIGRTLANTIAVFCFFRAVDMGSLAEANILNLTYPLFVAIFSWFFLRGQCDLKTVGIVIMAFAGIWLILSPENLYFGPANMWGLGSGIMAAAAMLYLNFSRRYHDSQTILFFMFGLGSVLIFALFHNVMFLPTGTEFLFLFGCAMCGVLGQYLITFGFRYVTAVEGSIITSSRILLAAILGPCLVNDPHLTLTGWVGALLIFVANVVLAMKKA